METATGWRGNQIGRGTGNAGQFMLGAADGWEGIHQPQGIRVHGVFKELAGRGAFDDLAGIHDGDIV